MNYGAYLSQYQCIYQCVQHMYFRRDDQDRLHKQFKNEMLCCFVKVMSYKYCINLLLSGGRKQDNDWLPVHADQEYVLNIDLSRLNKVHLLKYLLCIFNLNILIGFNTLRHAKQKSICQNFTQKVFRHFRIYLPHCHYNYSLFWLKIFKEETNS